MKFFLRSWYGHPKRVFICFIIYLLILFIGLRKIEFSEPGTLAANMQFIIIVRHFGLDAQEIERSLAIPLENALSQLDNIKELRSISSTNKLRIVLEFSGTKMERNFLSLREIIARVSSTFPKSVQRPQIFFSSGAQEAFYIVAIRKKELEVKTASSNLDLSSLNQTRVLVEEELKTRLTKILGVGEVEVAGGTLSEIHVRLKSKLANYGLSSEVLARQIQDAYQLNFLGRIKEQTLEFYVNLDGHLANLEELRNLIIETANGASLFLHNIADVYYSYRRPEARSRVNNNETVTLYIRSSGQASILSSSIDISREIEQWLPDTHSQELIFDRGSLLRSGLYRLLFASSLSVAIVVIFILIAYKNLGYALITGSSIILSGLSTIALLAYTKQPLDSDSISALAISIGIVADIAIIITVAMFKGPQASFSNLFKILGTLIASSLTSIVVLLPLLRLGSTNKSITTIAVIFIELIVVSTALNISFLPSFLGVLSRISPQPVARSTLSKKFLSKVVLKYFFRRSLVLRKKRQDLLCYLSMLLIVLTIVLIFIIPKKITNEAPTNTIFAHVELPSASNLEAVDRALKLIGTRALLLPKVKRVESLAHRENGSISLSFKGGASAAKEIVSALEKMSEELEGIFIYLNKEAKNESILELSLLGPDNDVLRCLAQEFSRALRSEAWVTQVVLHFKANRPIIEYYLDRQKLVKYQLTAQRLIAELRTKIYGPVILKWIVAQEEIDLRLQGQGSGNYSAEKIKNLGVLNLVNAYIPVQDLGSFEFTQQSSKLYRSNRQRAVYLSIHSKIDNLSELGGRLEASLSEFALPDKYSYSVDQNLIRLQKSYRKLLLSFMLAIILLYLLLAAIYESIKTPILVVLSILSSLSPVLLFLSIFQVGLNKYIILCLIIIVGILVNNVLFFIDELVLSWPKSKRESLTYKDLGHLDLILDRALEARIQHIFLTSASTILGQLALLFNSGPEALMLKNFALVIILGMLGSLLSVYFLLPALLSKFPRLL